MRLMCPEKRFEEKQAFEKEVFFKANWEPERGTVRLCKKFFDMVFEAAFYFSTNSVWISCMFFKDQDWVFCAIYDEKLQPFLGSFGRGRKCCMLHLQRSIFRKIFCPGKSLFLHFRSSKKKFTYRWTAFDNVAKTIYYVSRNNIQLLCKLRSISLSKTESKNFGRLASFFWQVYQNCILHVQRNSDRKQVFEKIFFIFWPWLVNLKAFRENVLGQYLKLHS